MKISLINNRVSSIRIGLILFLFQVSFFFSCNSVYELKPEGTKKSESDFDTDNTIYKKNKSFLFDVRVNNFKTDVNFISFEIIGGTLPFSDFDKNYKQTVFEIRYYDTYKKLLYYEATGLIDNNSNIWLHPPRSNEFLILQTNSFPMFINKKKWEWDLEFSYGEFDRFNAKHKYKLKKIDSVTYVIETKTHLNNKYAKARYTFNSVYGFTQMIFDNYDDSRIELNLISISDATGVNYIKK
ncbi:MAG: hypothetical protein O9303_13265 [Silanimonas sp.]|nr:hypothetical protein [Silanimonas sp.]